jgi:hypothetical protein
MSYSTEYQEPKRIFVGQHGRLYDLEDNRQRAIEACAKEWAKIKGVDDGRYWIETLPQALFDTLEAYDPHIATLAAAAFLKLHSWKVERPNSDPSRPIKLSEIADEATADEYLRRIIRGKKSLTLVEHLRDAHELADIIGELTSN